MDLTSDEHRLLERTAASGGRVSIRDESPAYMQHAANVANVLESRGLVNVVAHESRREPNKPVDLVVIELTPAGRRYLADQE